MYLKLSLSPSKLSQTENQCSRWIIWAEALLFIKKYCILSCQPLTVKRSPYFYDWSMYAKFLKLNKVCLHRCYCALNELLCGYGREHEGVMIIHNQLERGKIVSFQLLPQLCRLVSLLYRIITVQANISVANLLNRQLRKRWRTRCSLTSMYFLPRAFALFNCKRSSITLRFHIRLVSNWGWRLSEAIWSCPVNFSFVTYQTEKLRQQKNLGKNYIHVRRPLVRRLYRHRPMCHLRITIWHDQGLRPFPVVWIEL